MPKGRVSSAGADGVWTGCQERFLRRSPPRLWPSRPADLGHFAFLLLTAVIVYLGWVKEHIDRVWSGGVTPRLFSVVEGSYGEPPERQAEFLHRREATPWSRWRPVTWGEIQASVA